MIADDSGRGQRDAACSDGLGVEGTSDTAHTGSASSPSVPQGQVVPWNIAMVNAPAAWQWATGRGVKIAILDSGIDRDHPDLTVAGGVSFATGDPSWDDDDGSGTHCAGIIAARNNAVGVVGIAPDATLYAVKVTDRNGNGSLAQILAGMAWAAEQRMDIVVVAGGGSVATPNDDGPCLLVFQRAIEAIVAAGGIVVAPAGNSRQTAGPWVRQPARCPGVIAVAAVDRNATVTDFSSAGPGNLVTLAAPGVNIISTFQDGGYRALSGTTRSACHVAGAAALLRELNPGWDATQIRARLTETARDLPPAGIDPDTGAGLLDCHRAVATQ